MPPRIRVEVRFRDASIGNPRRLSRTDGWPAPLRRAWARCRAPASRRADTRASAMTSERPHGLVLEAPRLLGAAYLGLAAGLIISPTRTWVVTTPSEYGVVAIDGASMWLLAVALGGALAARGALIVVRPHFRRHVITRLLAPRSSSASSSPRSCSALVHLVRSPSRHPTSSLPIQLGRAVRDRRRLGLVRRHSASALLGQPRVRNL